MVLLATHNALFSAYFQADFFGKCIFFGLFISSILCWIVLIFKSYQVRKVRLLASAFEKALEKNHDRLLSLSVENQKHPFGHVFQALKKKTLEVLGKNQYYSEEKQAVYLTRSDLELVESHVLTTISSEAKGLEKNLFVLSTIKSLAPFLGLLGTVYGILLTFSELQNGGTASNTAMLGGLSTALVTTVLGLLIAIPALISHVWLRNSLKYVTSDMEDFLYKLLSTLELQYRKPQ